MSEIHAMYEYKKSLEALLSKFWRSDYACYLKTIRVKRFIDGKWINIQVSFNNVIDQLDDVNRIIRSTLKLRGNQNEKTI
jgi:predicted ATP-grasp superfamily ATP-dependent carboligase